MAAYKRLKNDHVPIAFQLAARRMAMRASEDLRIPTPRVVWWSGGRRGLYGWCDVDERGYLKNNNVNLNVDAFLNVEDIRFVVAHEARHQWQERYVRGGWGDAAKQEDDSNRYAFQVTHNKNIKTLDGWQAVRASNIWEVDLVQ
jgi:hypothetical protein